MNKCRYNLATASLVEAKLEDITVQTSHCVYIFATNAQMLMTREHPNIVRSLSKMNLPLTGISGEGWDGMLPFIRW